MFPSRMTDGGTREDGETFLSVPIAHRSRRQKCGVRMAGPKQSKVIWVAKLERYIPTKNRIAWPSSIPRDFNTEAFAPVPTWRERYRRPSLMAVVVTRVYDVRSSGWREGIIAWGANEQGSMILRFTWGVKVNGI